MSNQFKGLMDTLKTEEERLLSVQDALCYTALIDVFFIWARAFPKRDLTCTHGMGTVSFDTPKLDLFALLDSSRVSYMNWRPVHDTLLKPLLDYVELWDSNEIGPPPWVCDMRYKAITKTVEYDNMCYHIPTGELV